MITNKYGGKKCWKPNGLASDWDILTGAKIKDFVVNPKLLNRFIEVS